MPNLKTPGKKLDRKPQDLAAPAVPVATRAARRLLRQAQSCGQACLRMCVLIERFKQRGVPIADIEEELGLDAGDLQSHFSACTLVAENAGFTPPAWS